ncbi:MAG: glycosyltransferase family 4 protein [Flavobacteriales bacterium]|jgi:glycosyltransferase involved in cell wall biosynthesis
MGKKRVRVGILFSYSENWIGGSYYLLNLISALKLIEDHRKPEIVVFYKDEKDCEPIVALNYPYHKFINIKFQSPYNLWQRILFRFNPSYCKRKYLTSFDKKFIDVIFPYTAIEKFRNVKTKVYWYPDFQDFFYPEFFSEKELEQRKSQQLEFVNSSDKLVLSSRAALNDLKHIYSVYTCKPYVVNFAVTHPQYEHLNLQELMMKYGIDRRYYISPNQFWQHKNHLTLLKAVLLAKQKRNDILVVFTGKEYDYRNPEYTEMLKSFVRDNDLSNNVIFLGFIDRAHQLKLIGGSMAVIQPSLFEGWSTVVEDAKAMNKLVIASDIDVHREQMLDNVIFFEKENHLQLADILMDFSPEQHQSLEMDYSENVRKFANDFLNAIT